MQPQILLLPIEALLLTDFEVLRLEMGVDGEARTLYDVAHNIAKIETHNIHGKNCQCAIHRKGATKPSPAIVAKLRVVSS